MTAEIIQFAKPQSISAQFRPAGQESVQRRVKPEAENACHGAEVIARRGRPHDRFAYRQDPEIEAVRCTVDGRLYEVEFRGASVCYVFSVSYRNRDGRVDELRRRCWNAAYPWHYSSLDPAIVEAAKRARSRGDAGVSREAAIAQLRDRHARLLRQAEKVEATIAILQHGIN
jgi:hypothetical protein